MAGAKVLVLIPNTGFDPTETAVPWEVLSQSGCVVTFATESGESGACDPMTLTGQGLGPFKSVLKTHPPEVLRYERMIASAEFQQPLAWSKVAPEDFAALVLPGGHSKEMKPYFESEIVHDIIRNFFRRNAPVGAVCHGVLPVARTTLEDGKSVLHGRRTTALLRIQEKTGHYLARWTAGDHYRTYPEYLQDEVTGALASASDFVTGNKMDHMLGVFGSDESPDQGFFVRDGNYVSCRWPGDTHKWARVLRDVIAEALGVQSAL